MCQVRQSLLLCFITSFTDPSFVLLHTLMPIFNFFTHSASSFNPLQRGQQYGVDPSSFSKQAPRTQGFSCLMMTLIWFVFFFQGKRYPSASDDLRFWRREEKLCILKLDDTLSNSEFLVLFDSISRVELQISTILHLGHRFL